jgi:hypothetical protein
LDSIFDLDRHHRHLEGGRMMNRKTRRALTALLSASGLLIPSPTLIVPAQPQLWMPAKPAIVLAREPIEQASVPWFNIAMGAIPAVPATVTWAAVTTSTTDKTDTQTTAFSSQSISTAAANRRILIGVGFRRLSGSSIIAGSVVLDSFTTTKVAESLDNTPNVSLWITDDLVPTGTTGSVTVTWSGSGTMEAAGCSTFAAYALQSGTPTATDTDSGSFPHSMTITVQTNGFLVGLAFNRDSAGSTLSWSGASERHDTAVETINEFGGATGTAGGTITATSTGSMAGLVAAFR